MRSVAIGCPPRLIVITNPCDVTKCWSHSSRLQGDDERSSSRLAKCRECQMLLILSISVLDMQRLADLRLVVAL